MYDDVTTPNVQCTFCFLTHTTTTTATATADRTAYRTASVDSRVEGFLAHGVNAPSPNDVFTETYNVHFRTKTKCTMYICFSNAYNNNNRDRTASADRDGTACRTARHRHRVGC